MNRRKPTKILKLQGTYRPDRHERNEPEPESLSDYPEPPETLNKWGKKEWERVVPQLIELELVSGYDLGMLEAAMEHYGIYRECYDTIYYTDYRDKQGNKRRKKRTIQEFLNEAGSRSPIISLMKSSFNTYKELLYKFGATPVERTRIDTSQPEPINEMEAFLKQSYEQS